MGKLVSRGIFFEIFLSVLALLGSGLVFAEIGFSKVIDVIAMQSVAYEVNGLLGILVAAPAVLLVFSIRRTRDLQNEKGRRRLAEHEAIENARFDSLTGLPNRQYFGEEMIRRADRQKRRGGSLAMLHLDLDRFKQINDTLGPLAGDHILKHAAGLIEKTVRKEDMVARIGGDEFLIAQELEKGTKEAEALAKRLIDALSNPISYNGIECLLGASIGIAVHQDTHSQTGFDPERLMTSADIALSRAKEQGRGRFELFSETLRSEFESKKRLSDEIATALENQEFEPFYQIQVDALTHDVVGVEALARWRHPKRGILTPDKFLPLVEELKLTAEVDSQILRRTQRDQILYGFRQLGIKRVSVNISADCMAKGKLLRMLPDPVPGGVGLVLELTETVLFDQLDDTTKATLEDIKARGIEIEIDDFGTGHASVSSLMNIQPTRIKIDRSLVGPATETLKQRQLVRAIVDMAGALGIGTVAEGVETLKHADIVTAVGCCHLQGFAFAKPMAAEDLATHIRARPWRRSVVDIETIQKSASQSAKAASA